MGNAKQETPGFFGLAGYQLLKESTGDSSHLAGRQPVLADVMLANGVERAAHSAVSRRPRTVSSAWV